VHHWVIYQCSHDLEREYLSKNPVPQPGNCVDFSYTHSENPTNTWLSVSKYCRSATSAWAIGGDVIQDFPQGLGFPIGGENSEFTYFFIEVHYDNPQKIKSKFLRSVKFFIRNSISLFKIFTMTLE
jgi:hypothetical protein